MKNNKSTFHKLITYVIMALFSMLFMTACDTCSTEPVYYTKAEVKQYVKEHYGSGYKLKEKDSYPDDTEEENLMYEYTFENKDGVRFSVYTYTSHISIDASESIFYSKGITDDYVQSVIDLRIDDAMKCCEGAPFDVETEEDNDIRFYLDSYEQIPDAAEVIADIDAAISLKYNDSVPGDNRGVAVYIKPDEDVEDIDEWQDNYSYRICLVKYSNNPKSKLVEDDIIISIERSLVNGIKDKGKDYYTVPDELLYKYPATWIRVNDVNGVTDFEQSIAFSYDTNRDSYWINSLDPCQDFEDFPYNRTEEGTFASLVELFGGTYQCDDWKANWQIGNDKWTAWLIVDDDYRYVDFKVAKNGEELDISEGNGSYNGTVSGRGFSMEDIEKMLGVDIIVDQVSMTARIVIND